MLLKVAISNDLFLLNLTPSLKKAKGTMLFPWELCATGPSTAHGARISRTWFQKLPKPEPKTSSNFLRLLSKLVREDDGVTDNGATIADRNLQHEGLDLP